MDTILLDPNPKADAAVGCAGCRSDGFVLPITMAFQPIVHADGRVFAFEALVRGPNGEGAQSVLSAVTANNTYSFDQRCRTTAIETAAALGLRRTGAMLSINFRPNAIYEPVRCLRTSLAAARRAGLPNEAILFEITEDEKLHDPLHMRAIISAYRGMGFKVAIDDFGAGHSNLNLLADFQPDIVKLDMHLIRDIHVDRVRRTLVRSLVRLGAELGITLIAEGVEQAAEFDTLRELGIELFQGYLFARPACGVLPVAAMPPRS